MAKNEFLYFNFVKVEQLKKKDFFENVMSVVKYR